MNIFNRKNFQQIIFRRIYINIGGISGRTFRVVLSISRNKQEETTEELGEGRWFF